MLLQRPIQPQDWSTILDIQAECYQDFEPERLEVLQSKANIIDDSCFVIEHNQQIVGYCLAHPWQSMHPPALDQVIIAHASPDCLYLHDMAISAKARGLGAGSFAIQHLFQLAQQLGYHKMALIAVQGADKYWQKFGFEIVAIDKCLRCYTDDAVYMQLTLTQA
ncbi:GNAT family N-acetyltransferase [Shewanella marina]|uniref:GNAT family N-acetyltransferase n=1 Tax=Shewanella marina TaxID=487319 RepID=UPI00046FA5A0|nr:GNAT family N-acetyltransferase [Shewanella marina]